MKIFLTGGQGLLGSHIRRVCSAQSVELFAPPRTQLDLLNATAVRHSIAEFNPDVVIHCAGLVGGIADNIRRPYDYCFANMQTGLSVVDAARQVGVPKLINIGSANMYPEADTNLPLTEDALLTGKLNPLTSGYGLAKAAITKLVSLCNDQYGCCYRTLVPTNLYGEYDNFRPESSHMIPGIIRRLHLARQAEAEKVEIWGDGSARRAFLYAGDLAQYIVDNIQRLEAFPEVLNVAPDQDYSVLEYNHMVAEVVGYRGDFEFDHSKPTGAPALRLSRDLSLQYGWHPQTEIRDGIRATYQYFLSEVNK